MTDYNTSEPVPEITMTRRSNIRRIAKIVIVNAAVATFFVFATLKYIERSMTNRFLQYSSSFTSN